VELSFEQAAWSAVPESVEKSGETVICLCGMLPSLLALFTHG
jgi:hypothetical protein